MTDGDVSGELSARLETELVDRSELSRTAKTSRVEIEAVEGATQGTDGDACWPSVERRASAGRLGFGDGFFGAGNAEDGD